jgi:hypothetical protein
LCEYKEEEEEEEEKTLDEGLVQEKTHVFWNQVVTLYTRYIGLAP